MCMSTCCVVLCRVVSYFCLNFAAQVLSRVRVSVNISRILVTIPHQIAQQRYPNFKFFVFLQISHNLVRFVPQATISNAISPRGFLVDGSAGAHFKAGITRLAGPSDSDLRCGQWPIAYCDCGFESR